MTTATTGAATEAASGADAEADATNHVDAAASARDYERIARAIRWLRDHRVRHPSLADVARSAGLSEFHFQRLFRRWAGVSPKGLLQHLDAVRATGLLAESRDVLDVAHDIGLSGPSRLHDLLVAVEAASPGEVKSGGAGLRIAIGAHDSPFGACLVAATPRGICRLEFADRPDPQGFASRLEHDWPRAEVVDDREETASVAERVFVTAAGRPPERLLLHVRGTNFQLQVWRALLRIPSGAVSTYGRIAAYLDRPGAARAVGQAVGQNPVAWLIPCHRVLRETGDLGGYRWGVARKRAMLGLESARLARAD